MEQRLEHDLLSALAARKGHFLLESGHHGDLWIDLELLCLRPKIIQPFAEELAKRLARFNVELVCGPLVEGAFIGLLVAAELSCNFCYSERFAQPTRDGLFPAAYRVPKKLHRIVRQKRTAIINDVTNAGSAVRGSFEDLERCEARVVVIGSLMTLGTAAQEFAKSKGVMLESLADAPNTLWSPDSCPLCADGIPLEDVAGFGNEFSRTSL
jgi:orotate phosphoribosyltransferase